MPTIPLVLASSSVYRQALLKKLRVVFIAQSPAITETKLPDESPRAMALRLGIAKAYALQHDFPQHLIIGSDQVAAIGTKVLSKPGDRSAAIHQLLLASGQRMDFFTSICVLNTLTGDCFSDVDYTHVHFKQLTQNQIERYIELDAPFDCAGSFKVESLGIALFEKITGDDPNALIGLPLMKLITLLEKCHYPIL